MIGLCVRLGRRWHEQEAAGDPRAVRGRGPDWGEGPHQAARVGALGISGVHTHSLRHQFASEALDASPRELANISQVLGHDSIETTLRFYIHASANAEQRIGAMMNARWATTPASASNEA